MKQYFGIILIVFYSLLIRYLANIHVIEVNSIAFMFVTPAVISFIPFFLKDRKFLDNNVKIIFFPIISILLFLILAVINRWEDLACFIIIGFPYILVSIGVSFILKWRFQNNNDKLNKNALSIFILPILIGNIEKQLPKIKSTYTISNAIIINESTPKVYLKLLAVPNLTQVNEKGLLNIIGIPQPIYSSYNKISNTRFGYFENHIVLKEKVIENKINEKLVFKIIDKESNFKSSPTLLHIFETKNLEFNNITYTLTKISNNQTKLQLSTEFILNSNLRWYGKFWSNLIINDFESNLLKSLKKVIEKSITDNFINETNNKSIQNIQKIFENYINNEESTDSPDNKDLMTRSLKSLTKVSNSDDLELLINVWMYYDPTDFPSRELVVDILTKNKPESNEAVIKRMKNKKKWETDEIAPYSDLQGLLIELNK